MSNYKAKRSYKVVVVNPGGGAPYFEITLSGTNPSTDIFDTYAEAEAWIDEHGARQVTYTIIEVFRKP